MAYRDPPAHLSAHWWVAARSAVHEPASPIRRLDPPYEHGFVSRISSVDIVPEIEKSP
jgi:hypothetical protein